MAQRDDTGDDGGGPALDRAAALAAGPPGFPRKVLAIALACFVVLGLGGVLLDHLFPGPVGASVTTTTAGNYPPPLSLAPSSSPSAPRQLPASTAALMDLEHLEARPAPNFSLVDQDRQQLSLAHLQGKAVVLSFFDARCDDICRVLELELKKAIADLGPASSQLELVTVNTDPLALTLTSAHPALDGPLAVVPSWYFLTGSLAQLGRVWTSYGISVEVESQTHAVSHNDVLYFLDAAGQLRLRATPFANESRSGGYNMPPATEAQWAAGIAQAARSLIMPDRS
jgi:cytochrome oxidase Cu insertion factor (SCO1/SenC/PrrC family)